MPEPQTAEASLPWLRLLPLEAGQDLRIYALNGRSGQRIPPCCSDRDVFLSVQQGLVQLDTAEGQRVLQSRESEFLPAGSVFRLESMTDSRARMIMPAATNLHFVSPEIPAGFESLQGFKP